MEINGCQENCIIAQRGILDGPFVSIIVAAKDEERSIATTIKSILKQDYRNYELIVVNDRSGDRTGEIIENVKREAEKDGTLIPFTIIHITQLPQGWLGKNHALYQGYLHARGD